jgi:DeoR/GlpR family transcriptional regulator of sugar metabolism
MILIVRTTTIYNRTHTMDVHLRHLLILQSLQDHGEVQVSSLALALDCSEMTIRRDLESLEGLGGLRRVHGGAVSLYLSAEEAPFEIRALENIEAKIAIAAATVDLLVEGETVILDGGSTSMEVARSMHQRRLTVMPLALRPVLELDCCPGIKLLLPGGEVRTRELSLVGGLSEHAFSQLRFDTFVMGICGIDASAGVTTQMLAEADVKRAAIKAARRVIAVADASKIGRAAFGHVCAITDIDILVTDSSADDLIVNDLMAAGVDVRRA